MVNFILPYAYFKITIFVFQNNLIYEKNVLLQIVHTFFDKIILRI